MFYFCLGRNVQRSLDRVHSGSASSSCAAAAALAASSKSNKNVTRAAYETMSRSFCCLRETELRMSRVATSMSNDSSSRSSSSGGGSDDASLEASESSSGRATERQIDFFSAFHYTIRTHTHARFLQRQRLFFLFEHTHTHAQTGRSSGVSGS